MEHFASFDELTLMHQFDRICQLALDGEAIDYHRHMAYRKKHEVSMSEMSETEMNRIFIMDEYNVGSYQFQALSYDIAVEDDAIAEALKTLSEKKRTIILLSYFMGMSDAEIAREMNLARSTVHEHRTRSLTLLKHMMEERLDENQ